MNPTTDGLLHSRTEYDLLGRRVAEFDAHGQKTCFQFDDAGRLTDVMLPSGVMLGTCLDLGYHYGLDVYGNKLSTTDPRSNQTKFTLDHFNRQTSRTLPLGVASSPATDFVERMWYDDSIVNQSSASVGFGQLAYSIDFEGRVTRYVYDNTSTGGGRLVRKDYFAPVGTFLPTATTTLADVRLVFDAQTVANSISHRYDAFGRQAEVLFNRDGGIIDTTRTTFDADGRMTREVAPEGTINHEFDRAGRMTNRIPDTLLIWWMWVVWWSSQRWTEVSARYHALCSLPKLPVLVSFVGCLDFPLDFPWIFRIFRGVWIFLPPGFSSGFT